jgi:hypothetical protein
MGDEVGWDIDDRLAGEGVLLAQPVGVRQSDALRHFAAQPMPVMNRRCRNGAFAPLHRPPKIRQWVSPCWPCNENG